MREKQKMPPTSNHSPTSTAPTMQETATPNASAHGHSFGNLPVLAPAPVQAARKGDSGYSAFLSGSSSESSKKPTEAPKSSGYSPFLSSEAPPSSAAKEAPAKSDSGYAPFLKKK